MSYNGMDLFNMGDATADSAHGGLAIAYGAGSVADAGTYTNPDGVVTTGIGDFAFADGADSTAIATGADYSSATASDGATADSGIAILPGGGGLSSSSAVFESASASGVGSTADAEGGSFDAATASGGGTADSGFMPAGVPGEIFVGGGGDSASASGTGSTADAGPGINDIAYVFGSSSHAIAGGSLFELNASNDFAAAFGNGLTANATGAFNLFQIATPFGDFDPEAAGAVPSDDLGLSTLLSDLSSWLGL